MTGMLASVCSIEETRMVMDAGVDIIDLKNPDKGALGALNIETVREIVEYVNGLTPISATIGDIPFRASILEPHIEEMALTGVDIVKVGVFDDFNGEAELQLLTKFSQQGIRIVLVMFAERYARNWNIVRLKEMGVVGLMLDTLDKTSGSLRNKMSDSNLQQFVDDVASLGLLTGLAGSLGENDISPLLEMNSDYIGFRGGLCKHGKRGNMLDQESIRKVRQVIPQTQLQFMRQEVMT